MKTIIEDYIENIVTNHMNIIRKNQCADLLLFCVDILINNSENNNYEKDLNHIICEILLLMKNSPERCAFLLKAGMDGGIREAAFAIKNLSEYSGELKNVNFSLNSYLLKTIDSKLKMISEYPLVFGLYDVVSGIAGDLYYLLDCDDILSDTKSLLKIKEILNVIVSLSDDYQFKGMNIIRFHIKQEQQYQKSERDEMINGHINLGMAHGIMGALIVLAKAYKLGIFQRRDTILKLYHIYKKFEKRNGEILRYPRRLSVEKYNEGKWNDLNMNCGWCYGNISIVRGMMKVSSYMNWEDEYKFYAARLVNIINQSLGQWQKVALARAFIKNAELYILDEPNSALDSIAEADMLKLYEKIIRNHMGIIVTHKFNVLVKRVDRIVVLSEGVISGIGTHESLLKLNSDYRKMYEAQDITQ